MTNQDGTAKFPNGYADYLTYHERQPGIGSLAGWRGADGSEAGRGEPNPEQLRRYVEHGCFWQGKLAPGLRFYKHANQAYLDYAAQMGFVQHAEPIALQLYSEALQKFRLAAQGHGPLQPPDAHRERIRTYFDPLPFWYQPFEDAGNDEAAFPLHAITQRPAAMYHSWGGMNPWLRQIHSFNRLYLHRVRAAQLGLEDDDWVWVTSRHGRIKAQVKLMDGVNPDTCWTWNAIGKRGGTWHLSPDAPEVTRGFLLNHLIDELLPEREGGYRYANADPVTGQAAWYDLRVRIERASPAEARLSAPQFAPVRPPANGPARPATSRYGLEFRARR